VIPLSGLLSQLPLSLSLDADADADADAAPCCSSHGDLPCSPFLLM
jgi:hypothetical protein